MGTISRQTEGLQLFSVIKGGGKNKPTLLVKVSRIFLYFKCRHQLYGILFFLSTVARPPVLLCCWSVALGKRPQGAAVFLDLHFLCFLSLYFCILWLHLSCICCVFVFVIFVAVLCLQFFFATNRSIIALHTLCWTLTLHCSSDANDVTLAVDDTYSIFDAWFCWCQHANAGNAGSSTIFFRYAPYYSGIEFDVYYRFRSYRSLFSGVSIVTGTFLIGQCW